jgi:Rrf2 family transcriptional regulator, iron-sulfur cluster assembly transcription factor
MRESLFVFPQTAEYAVRAIAFIAATVGDGPVRVKDVARATDIPVNYLSKTLNHLARVGLLQSTRGPLGGFALAVPPENISLGRIAEIFSGPDGHQCLLGGGRCGERTQCAVHKRWYPVATQVREFLEKTTIAQIVTSSSPHTRGIT